ncbi:hypothetical protein M434DRAFT_381987 [Hypoxylon sp. CO27-5]|nr:hypothetical protein M434DRAFT_381987 [Hypoxylon sp. CO27-5]
MDGHPAHVDPSSDSNPSTTMLMKHQKPNLDYIVVRVSHQSRSVDFTLNSYLDNSWRASSIRISSHYDYEGIRNFIQEKTGLPPTDPLVFNGTEKICSKHDLELLIIGIQIGIKTLPSLPGLAIPGLILQSESPAARESLVMAGELSVTNTPINDTHLPTKRQHSEDLEQSCAKRLKSPTPTIELSNEKVPSMEAEAADDSSNESESSNDTSDSTEYDNLDLEESMSSSLHNESSLDYDFKNEHTEDETFDNAEYVDDGSDEESTGDSLDNEKFTDFSDRVRLPSNNSNTGEFGGYDFHSKGRTTTIKFERLDDDADEEDRHQQVEDISGRFAHRNISAEDWRSVCRMFQCPEDSREYQPIGFKLAISDYQLHAVWWQITQFPIRGLPGGCLGDEMGLGKTIEVLSVFAVFALIKMNYGEVYKYWEKGEINDGRTHLPKHGQTATDLICPSQHKSPYGLLCPCVKFGETYAVAEKLPSLPTICFVRPGSIQGWRREYEKLIDPCNPIMKNLKFSIIHNDFKEDDRYYHGEDSVRATMAEATKFYVDKLGKPNYHLSGRKGLSDWFVLASSSGAQRLYGAYAGQRVIYRGKKGEDDRYEGRRLVINCLAASFVFLDESHTYRGSLYNPTMPFYLLRLITEKALKPTIAFSVSGSISEGGPSQLTSIVDHILRVKRQQGEGKPSVGGITSAAQLERSNSDWNYLLQKNHIIINKKTKAEVKRRRDSLHKLMKNLVPHILMARRGMDTFRGRIIGEIDHRIILKHIRCNMLDGPGRDAFCKLTGNVRGYIGQALEERLNDWVRGGKQGSRPTQRSVEQEFFDGPSDKTTMKLGKAWTQLLRTNVYPMVARLYLDDLVHEADMSADSINRYGSDACSLAVSGASRGDLLNELGKSIFWSYRAQLRDQSSKFQMLCEYVDDMVAHRKRQPNAEDPGPADGTNIRHMVVFTDSPLSSFITYMLLSEKYPEIQVRLINGRTPILATKKAPEYGRREMVDDLMSDCTNESRNKILVSTYRICGTALNLQRANYCILMEPARDVKEEKQAAARISRRGQQMKPVTVRLHDDRNLPEVLRRARHQNQGNIVSWQKEGIQWADFV